MRFVDDGNICVPSTPMTAFVLKHRLFGKQISFTLKELRDIVCASKLRVFVLIRLTVKHIDQQLTSSSALTSASPNTTLPKVA
jgi:hypothetical protein